MQLIGTVARMIEKLKYLCVKKETKKAIDDAEQKAANQDRAAAFFSLFHLTVCDCIRERRQ